MPPRRLDPRALPSDSILGGILNAPARAARAPVFVEHDGERVPAFEGESVALALLAAGRQTLARSVKFHRPRGPACLRGACEGCLVRLDGVPNVMACRVGARDGAAVHSQNSFPSAAIDVLSVTDWFFPKEFDHHHLMVGYGTTLNQTMQVFARRMAGLGKLPDGEGPRPRPEVVDCDALVVGAGPAGLAAAAELASGRARVLLVEEEREVGGTLRDELGALPSATSTSGRVTGPNLADALEAWARRAGADVRIGASAGATFDNGTLVVTDAGALLVRARVRVFANGCHEIVGAFENNDTPGVYTARAAARALARGVLLGERVVIAGESWPAGPLAEAMREAGAEVTYRPGARVEAVEGRRAVRAARVREGESVTRHKCDALIVAEVPTPSFELLGQAGVAARPEAARRCFAPAAGGDGATERADVFAAGSVRAPQDDFAPIDLRRPMDAGGPVAEGRRVAKRALAALGRHEGAAR